MSVDEETRVGSALAPRQRAVGAGAWRHAAQARRQGGLRGGQPEERARRGRRRLDEGNRQASATDLLCRQLGAGQADRGGRAGRRLHLGRSRLDGLPRQEEPDQARDARQPARQQPRAGRAQGLQDHDDRRSSRASTSPRLLGDGRLAMGNVDAVPAGKYGKAALEKLGAWDGVEGQVAQAENVRAALALVSRGEAPLGIVYQTDAAAEPECEDRRHLPGGQPSADHLSGRGRPSECRTIADAEPLPGLSCAPPRRSRRSRSRASRSWSKARLSVATSG